MDFVKLLLLVLLFTKFDVYRYLFYSFIIEFLYIILDVICLYYTLCTIVIIIIFKTLLHFFAVKTENSLSIDTNFSLGFNFVNTKEKKLQVKFVH